MGEFEMDSNRGWRLASTGLRLKLVALLLLSAALCAAGVLVVSNPKLFMERIAIGGALAAVVLIVAVDFAGRSLCLATPMDHPTRIVVGISMVFQLASVAAACLAFVLDRDVEIMLRLIIAIPLAVAAQAVAAVLFMRYARELAHALNRPDLAVKPTRVLVFFGLAGSSLVATGIVLLVILFLLMICGGCLVYTPVNALFRSGPKVLLPVVILILGILVAPFLQYGMLMHNLAKAIDQRRELSRSNF